MCSVAPESLRKSHQRTGDTPRQTPTSQAYATRLTQMFSSSKLTRLHSSDENLNSAQPISTPIIRALSFWKT